MKLLTKRKINSILLSVFRTILLAGLCYVIVLPLLNRTSTALMSMEDLYDPSVRWIPRYPTLSNFRLAMEYMDYGRAFMNTFLLSTVTGVIQVPVCKMVA